MPIAPDADNYVLGRGKVYFDKLVSGAYEGERDLGNSPSVNLAVAMEKLEHFSSRSGLKAKDKVVVTQVTPAITFTLDEINVENFALMFLGSVTEVVQAANTDGIAADLGTVIQNRFYDVGDYRSLLGAVTYLEYSTGSALFVVGEVVTGGTSTDTATVLAVWGDATEGILVLDASTVTAGDFQAEAITGSIAGSANILAACVQTAAGVPLVALSDGTAVYTVTTDFTVDAAVGRIKVVDGGGITASTDISVAFTVAAATYTTIGAFAETSIEGTLRFVPDNPVGNNMELKIWRVDLTPSGEAGMIGDDWQTFEFSGEILKDETNHASNPYMEIITSDTV